MNTIPVTITQKVNKETTVEFPIPSFWKEKDSDKAFAFLSPEIQVRAFSNKYFSNVSVSKPDKSDFSEAINTMTQVSEEEFSKVFRDACRRIDSMIPNLPTLHRALTEPETANA